MRAITISSHADLSSSGRLSTRTRSVVEPLERRTLFAGWSTVDDFQLATGRTADVTDMTSDAAGNIYAVGAAMDAAGEFHGVVREKPVGATAWGTTLVTSPPQASWLDDVVTNAAGDVYVLGGNFANNPSAVVLRRAAGQSQFVTIDQMPGDTQGGLAVDAAGNVFAAVRTPVTVTTTGPGNKTTTSTQVRSVIRKQAGGVGPFVTLPTQFTQAVVAMCSIPAGPSAGLYLVGGLGWDVWKSTNAGNSWSHVDTFGEVGGLSGNEAFGISGDSDGNLYVTGMATHKMMTGGTAKRPVYSYKNYMAVRRSADGGATWTNDDLHSLTGGSSWAYGAEVGVDAAGNVYTVGPVTEPDGAGGLIIHNIVRQKLRGSSTWVTIDDVVGEQSTYGFAADPSGNVYAGSYHQDNGGRWIVRSMAAPAPAAPFSSTAIAGGTVDDEDDDGSLASLLTSGDELPVSL